MKYYKLKEPEIISAIQFDGTNIEQILEETCNCFDIVETDEGFIFCDNENVENIAIGNYIVRSNMTPWYVSDKTYFESRHEEVPHE